MSILNHALWPALRPYLRIELYARDGGTGKPRHRIELHPVPMPLRATLLAMQMPCVDCGALIHPIRQRGTARRGTTGHLYYAATCPLAVQIRCSRGTAARDEYLRVKVAVSDDVFQASHRVAEGSNGQEARGEDATLEGYLPYGR